MVRIYRFVSPDRDVNPASKVFHDRRRDMATRKYKFICEFALQWHCTDATPRARREQAKRLAVPSHSCPDL
jgi:hypothetical protein